MALNLNTLSNEVSLFLRDVLRNKLTDTQSPPRAGNKWIFKGQPEALEFDYPYVVLREDGEVIQKFSLDATRSLNIIIRFEIQVWANKLEERDKLADEIAKIFRNPASTNAAGTSIKKNRLVFQGIEKSDADMYITEEEMVRIKVLLVEFKYIGS